MSRSSVDVSTRLARQISDQDRRLLAAVARGEVVSQRMDVLTAPGPGCWVALWRHTDDEAPVTRRVQARVRRLERLELVTCQDTSRADVRAVEPTDLGRAVLTEVSA